MLCYLSPEATTVNSWRAPLAECPRKNWIQACDGVPVSAWLCALVPRWSPHPRPSLWCCSSPSSSTIR